MGMQGTGMHPSQTSASRTEAEGRRILPQLEEHRSFLAPLGEQRGSRRAYGLFGHRNGEPIAVAPIPARVVDAFLGRGWIARAGEGLRITPEGSAWLRRQTAKSEPFRQQHQLRTETTRVVAGARRPVLVNEAESPLGWLRRRKDKAGAPLITDYQYQAGERLRADFSKAQMTPRVTANWSSPAPSRRSRRLAPPAGQDLCDDALAAKQRVMRALGAVGPELAGILVDVCCHLIGLGEAEHGQGWPRRSGKVILQLALTRLARHYGLVKETELAAPIRRRLRHWGTDDFKPTLDAWEQGSSV